MNPRSAAFGGYLILDINIEFTVCSWLLLVH